MNSLDSTLFYPVVIDGSNYKGQRIDVIVHRSLEDPYTSGIAKDNRGTVLWFEYSFYASGWGVLSENWQLPMLNITKAYTEQWLKNDTGNCCGNLGQGTESSSNYFYLRGGQTYYVEVSRLENISINFYTSEWTDGIRLTLAPLSEVPVPRVDSIPWNQIVTLFESHGIILEEGKITAKNGFFEN